jgi:hypothetical protein
MLFIFAATAAVQFIKLAIFAGVDRVTPHAHTVDA